MKQPFFISTFFIILLAANFNYSSSVSKTNHHNNLTPPPNHPPVVKIIAPQNNSVYKWNAQVPYKISVSDEEDGESKYNEINAKEVFLEIKYMPDATKALALLKQKNQQDAPGLAVIKTSNCFNCHGFKEKKIAPSFLEISKRYPLTKKNIALLAKRIREGSSGIWGTAKMPSHSELSVLQTQNIMHWIFENATNSNLDYYTGITGSFRLIPSAAVKQKGVFIITASYTDHGIKNAAGKKLKGEDRIIIYAEEY